MAPRPRGVHQPRGRHCAVVADHEVTCAVLQRVVATMVGGFVAAVRRRVRASWIPKQRRFKLMVVVHLERQLPGVRVNVIVQANVPQVLQ